ncbi:MAG: VCBS repeat-containing protein [Myxococcales bacterium]|nr:VCBS repeat-containing protein [Myxococcales bacterium]
MMRLHAMILLGVWGCKQATEPGTETRTTPPSTQPAPTPPSPTEPTPTATEVPPQLPGDHDDVIVSTEAGSQWLFAVGDGTWFEGPFRDDLGTADAELTPADFDGDGLVDLVVTTSAGSEVWIADGVGWYDTRWTDSGTRLGEALLVPSDVDGDGQSELFVVAPDAWYRWTWTGSGFDSQLFGGSGLGEVALTSGDFDGDGSDDLVITSMGQSQFVYSGGTFPALTLQHGDDLVVDFVPFDMEGDGDDDVLVVDTTHGTQFWGSGPFGHWEMAPDRLDLPVDSVQYDVGDIDGDGREDLVITTVAAVSLYLSRGDGTFDADRIDPHVLGEIAYTVLDVDGDGSDELLSTTDEGTALLTMGEAGAMLELGTLPYALGQATFTIGDLGYWD